MVSKNNDDKQYIWDSTVGESFFVQKDTEVVHGEVEDHFHISEDQSDF